MTQPAVHEPALAGIAASLAACLPHRVVQRSLVLDPLSHDPAELARGVVCLVSASGGSFANYRGREGQLGRLALQVVCFLKVPEASAAVAIEQAELALLDEVLAWVGAPLAGLPPGAAMPWDVALPGDWRQSRQQEHPYGWLVLELDVRP